MLLSMQAMFAKSRQSGFTVIEVIIVTFVIGVLTVPIMSALGDLYTSTYATLGKTTQDTDTRVAMRSIENTIKNNVGFLGVKEVDSPLGVGGTGDDWRYLGAGTGQRALIVQTYATDKPSTDPTYMPVFMKATTGDCTSRAEIAIVTQIYYLQRDSSVPAGGAGQYDLYRRTILPSTTLTDYCKADGTGNVMPIQRQTCASGCASKDALLVRGVSAFNVDYFTDVAAAVMSVASTDSVDKAADVKDARAAKVTLETTRKIQGELAKSTVSGNVVAGMNFSLVTGSAGAVDSDSSTDPTGGSPCGSAEYLTAGTFTYNIPACAKYIDVVLIGGGGGGQGGASMLTRSHGKGGSSGEWSYSTLQRGADIDTAIERLRIVVGGGGGGGQGFGTNMSTLLGGGNGKRGGNTTAEQINPTTPGVYGPEPVPLAVSWIGLTAAGGSAGYGYGENDYKASWAVPKTLSYLGKTYAAGAPGEAVNVAGLAPGGGGAGGRYQVNLSSNGQPGAAGAQGAAWIRAY